MISPELARIVAHICGDGYVGTYIQRRSPKELIVHPRKNLFYRRWVVRYVNTEPALVKQFVQDAKREFKRVVVPREKKHEYELSAKWIYEKVTFLGAGKSHDWFIHDEILASPRAVKAAWLQAFFDDEAHVSRPQKRIVLNIVNKPGLRQVKKLLQEFGIRSTLHGPYKYGEFYSYHLNIYRDSIPRYAEDIGFYHPKKKAHLAEILKGTYGGARI